MKTLSLSLLVLTLISTALATPSDLSAENLSDSREREKLRRGFTESSKPKPKDISISTSVKKARAATG
jgi:hypothetical protein